MSNPTQIKLLLASAQTQRIDGGRSSRPTARVCARPEGPGLELCRHPGPHGVAGARGAEG